MLLASTILRLIKYREESLSVPRLLSLKVFYSLEHKKFLRMSKGEEVTFLIFGIQYTGVIVDINNSIYLVKTPRGEFYWIDEEEII
jgi:hypothetical protein